MPQPTDNEQTEDELTPVSGGTGTSDVRQSLAGSLVRRYVERPSGSTAEAMIRVIDRRRDHPGESETIEKRCAWLRLRAHWQMLALTGREG